MINDRRTKELDKFLTANQFSLQMYFAGKCILLKTTLKSPENYIDGMVFDKIDDLGFKILDARVLSGGLTLTIFVRKL